MITSSIRYFLLLAVFFVAGTCASQAIHFNYTTNNNLCVGDNTYTPTSPTLPPGGTFSYSPNNGGLLLNSTTGVISGSLSSPGNYTVTYYGSSCNCTYTTHVVMNNQPSLSIKGGSVCAGSLNYTLAAVPPTGLSYTWQPMGTNFPVVQIPTSTTANINTFSLGASNAAGCKNTAVITITVYGIMPLQIQGTNSVCAGSQATLTATGPSKVLWNTGSTSSVIVVKPLSTTSYTVKDNEVPQCNFSQTIQVQVVQSPTLSVASKTACSGDTITMKAKYSPLGTSVVWLPVAYIGDSLTFEATSSITFTVRGTRAGCTSTVQSNLSVTTSTVPNVNFQYHFPICLSSGDSVPILPADFPDYGLFTTQPFAPINPTTGVLSLDYLQPGVYNVTYSVARAGCLQPATHTEYLLVSNPVDLRTPPPLTVAIGSEIPLPVEGGSSYTWDPSPYISCTACSSPTVAPPSSTLFCVSADADGCITKRCIEITVRCTEEGDLKIPNAFTPNNDGHNDQLCLKGWTGCNNGFSIMIYDRWGALVFQSSKPDFCWDGMYNGQLLAPGIYAYHIEANFNNVPVAKSGYITIIR